MTKIPLALKYIDKHLTSSSYYLMWLDLLNTSSFSYGLDFDGPACSGVECLLYGLLYN